MLWQCSEAAALMLRKSPPPTTIHGSRFLCLLDKYQTAKSLGSSFEIHNFFEVISYASTAWATAFPVSTVLQIYAKLLGQQGPDFGNCYSSNVPARPPKELQISTEKPNLLWNLPISEYWRLLNPRGSCTGAKED